MRQFSIDQDRAGFYLSAGESATSAEREFQEQSRELRADISEIEYSAKRKGLALNDTRVSSQLPQLKDRLTRLMAQHAAGAERREYDIFLASKVRAAMPDRRGNLPFIARPL